MLSNIEKLDLLEEKVSVCMKCPALCEGRIKTVFGTGNPNPEIVILGEGPGREEAESGLPFVGKSGKLLTNILESLGIQREDVYILNIVKCRPPNNRTPLPEEANNCRSFLDLQLQILKPKYIVCLGACAAQNLLKTTATITSLRGVLHQLETPVQAQVLATYHPSYLLRNPPAKKLVWEDLQLLPITKS